MRPADRTDYIVRCLIDAASMYEEDAKAFLAEHDADHWSEVLREAADLIEAEQHRLDDAENARHGYLDHESELQHTAVHAMGALLRRVADGQPASSSQPDTGELTATLNVDRSESRCSHCGKPTLVTGVTHHTDISGWTPQPGGGCGARFTAIAAANSAITPEVLREMRPDLPVHDRKDTASSGESTQPVPSPDRLQRYAAALREADTYAQLADRRDFERFATAAIAMADTELDPVYRSGYRTGRMHAGGQPTHADLGEFISCSASHCSLGEWDTKAAERGWQHGHMDTWVCPEHRTDGAKGATPRVECAHGRYAPRTCPACQIGTRA